MSADALQPPPDIPTTSVPSASTSAADSGVIRRKNGAVSKMRSHRGNIPTLPQTKFCHLCSAKFTRTTHLNRHLKTHSNERGHECERCHAQFTRSDLLTRHRRTCCDSSANRSRRKSCQSCAESKVKCDLQRPCAKCKARGRECVYANGTAADSPEAGSSSQQEGSSPEATTSPSGSSQNQGSPPEAAQLSQASTSIAGSTPSTIPNLSSSSDLFSGLASLSAFTPVSSSSTPLPTSTVNFDPLAAAVLSTPAGPSTNNLISTTLAVSINGNGNDQDTDEKMYGDLFSNEMYDGLFSDVFTTSFQKNPAVPGQHFLQDPTAMLTDRLESIVVDPTMMEAFFNNPAMLAIYSTPSPSVFPYADPTAIPESEVNEAMSQTQAMTAIKDWPTLPEMYEFIETFFNTYTYHMPVIHLPTFLSEPRHPLLVKASKASGAMYFESAAAINFIDRVLATVRDEIIADLSHATDYDTIIQLALASGMIQTIGMFHRNPEQRAKSNVYHGMIVMMLRMNGFVDKTRDWKLEPIDFSDPENVQKSWREWVRHESAKRAIWLCYLHDCCHAIFFNLSPTLHTEQFTLGLPSEDALWAAKDATEWAQILQTPSPYGSVEIRLCGHHLKTLYFYLVRDNPQNEPRQYLCSPFGHFIMIHAMMRKLFEMYLRDRLPFQTTEGAGPRPQLKPHFVDKDRVYHIQILLHCWLQSWQQSPETPRDVPESHQRFLFNALPFYWLTQVGLVAYQQGLPPFDAEGVYITSHEAKFHLMKKWEKHIRKFLERGEEAPTMFWDEVMKTRTESWQQESGFEFAHLLGFFHSGRESASGSGSV
ncbi:hypothetical protein K466DRAFT_667145 [Polyporus arcularius HHB13444]|uniref:Zn(2)-C6 fungal-type domain-containing protein n=1 Tax=Polyporus arcularius HHB13444 TaxID=1314778 RepID=A0A5C3NVQ8_9APHY|nr:hypothetical protein K466DRAFT_667145 [Polyporus arcularius HHB13444]